MPSQQAPKATATKKPRKRKADPKQFERFVQAAHKAEVDESPEALDRAFDRVAGPRTGEIHKGGKPQGHGSRNFLPVTLLNRSKAAICIRSFRRSTHRRGCAAKAGTASQRGRRL